MAGVITQKSFSAGSDVPPTTPGKLRMYGMRLCPFVQRTRLVLAHKNIDFETVNIDLMHKPAWYFEKNPLGLVPTLEVDDKIVYESTATAEWLDDVYPDNRLTPADPYRKAHDRMLLEYLGKLVSCYVGLFKGTGDREQHIEGMKKHYAYYERVLVQRGSTFFGGDGLAMLDFYIWPFFERIQAFLGDWEPEVAVTKEKWPRLRNWVDAMYQTRAVKATIFDNDTHRRYATTSRAGNPDYDYKL